MRVVLAQRVGEDLVARPREPRPVLRMPRRDQLTDADEARGTSARGTSPPSDLTNWVGSLMDLGAARIVETLAADVVERRRLRMRAKTPARRNAQQTSPKGSGNFDIVRC